MATDSSYAEYVVARWPMLYRLATLLVGEEQAGWLAEAALVRAYRRWPDVEAAASADEHVQGLLARTAVEDFASKGAGPGFDGPGFDGLTTRRRAVVVLCCFELLGEVEVARALACPEAEVRAERAAALAALGLSETAAAAELERRSEAAVVPPAPVEDLVTRGRAARRRQRGRTWRWSGVAVAVAVAALAVANLSSSGHDEAKRPLPPIPSVLAGLPAGGPPAVAFFDGRTLLLQGGPLALKDAPVEVVQGGSSVYVVYPSGEVDQVDDRSLRTTTVTRSSAGQVVTDPSGRHVAWLEPQQPGAAAWVTVRAATSDADVPPERDQVFPAGAAPFVLDGMDRSGDLVASRPAENRAWVWQFGSNPAPGRPVLQEIQGLGANAVVRQVTSDDVVVEDGPSQFAIGEVRDGTFFVADEIPAAAADFSDPESRRIVYVDFDGRVHVIRRARLGQSRPRGDVRLRLPALRGGFQGMRWEDGDHVLLDLTDSSLPAGALVRCDVGTGACEIAAKFDGLHLLAR